MGTSESKDRSIESFLREYEEVRTEYDQRVGEVKIYKKIKNPEIKVLIKEKWFEHAKAFQKFLRRVKRRRRISCENVAPILLVLRKLKF